ncbi:hypothetical protein GCM10010340_34420 [Streptomyces griseoloalbus]|nr:hypothetical protein GCM10010294_00520 [Streptomyces griseoloalbus]GGW52895.1 hypothetical protein GCM10010340_34420 [Streptomyces albaduncus]
MTLRPPPAADSRGRSPGLAATLEGCQFLRVPRRAGSNRRVVILTGPDVRACEGGRGPRDVRCGYEADAPAAFAASRTAPATAPATLSLNTLGMM